MTSPKAEQTTDIEVLRDALPFIDEPGGEEAQAHAALDRIERGLEMRTSVLREVVSAFADLGATEYEQHFRQALEDLDADA